MKHDILHRIRAVYLDRHGPVGYMAFNRELLAILKHGYLFHTPTCCLMGFRCFETNVRHAVDMGYPITPRIHSDDRGDTWFVWFALGSLQEILSFVPVPLKNVAFTRRDVVRVWSLARLMRLAQSNSTSCLSIDSPLAGPITS